MNLQYNIQRINEQYHGIADICFLSISEILGAPNNFLINKCMTKLEKLNNNITNFSTAAFAILLYSVKEQMHLHFQPWLQNLGIFIISGLFKYIASHICGFALQLKFIRKLICGKMYLEGHWSLDSKSTNSPFSDFALAKIIYDPISKCQKIIAYRLNNKKEIFTTTSEYVLPYGNNEERLVNFFSSAINDEKVDGISSGYFTQSPTSKYVDTYNGHIATFHDSMIIKQTGYRIRETKIDDYVAEHGKNWEIAFLKDNARI